jgi:hypothetical protein
MALALVSKFRETGLWQRTMATEIRARFRNLAGRPLVNIAAPSPNDPARAWSRPGPPRLVSSCAGQQGGRSSNGASERRDPCHEPGEELRIRMRSPARNDDRAMPRGNRLVINNVGYLRQ